LTRPPIARTVGDAMRSLKRSIGQAMWPLLAAGVAVGVAALLLLDGSARGAAVLLVFLFLVVVALVGIGDDEGYHRRARVMPHDREDGPYTGSGGVG
jgi:hypothetical protein